MKTELRAYQDEALNSARGAFQEGSAGVCLWSPCGSGKTVMAAAAARSAVDKGLRVLFLAHRKELCEQAFDKMLAHGIRGGKMGVVMASDDAKRFNPSAPLQIASKDTLVSRLDTFDAFPGFDLVIIDETHLAAAETFKKILQHRMCRRQKGGAPSWRLGLTATPYRLDGKGLDDLYDTLILVASDRKLQSLGHSVPPRVFMASRLPLDLDALAPPPSGGDYSEKALGEYIEDVDLRGDCVAEYNRISLGESAIVYAVNVEHSLALAEAFRRGADGVRWEEVEHVDGETPQKKRDEIMQKFVTGGVKILCNVDVATTGFDAPRIKTIILARPTKSRMLYKQMCGRGARPFEGKKHYNILDMAGNVIEHGWPDAPEEVSLKGSPGRSRRDDDGDQARRCESCGGAVKIEQLQCPVCHAILPPPPPKLSPEMKRVILTDEYAHLAELSPEEQIKTLEHMQRFYDMTARQAWERDWKPGFASAKFKERFGAYPPGVIKRKTPYKTKGFILKNHPTKKYTEVWDRQAIKEHKEQHEDR